MYFFKSPYNVSQPEKEKTDSIKSKVRSELTLKMFIAVVI